MGRKALFNQEQVFQVADALVGAGKDVTAKALLDALGGGSLTTIYRHLLAWQETRPDTGMLPVEIDIPAPVQTAFANAWRTATIEAARSVCAIREKATEDVKAAQKQFREALEQIERLEAESDTDSERIDSLSNTLSELQATLHTLERELAAENACSSQLRDQLASQESELFRTRNEKDKAANEAAELRGQNLTLQEQNAKLLIRLPQPTNAK